MIKTAPYKENRSLPVVVISTGHVFATVCSLVGKLTVYYREISNTPVGLDRNFGI